MAPVLQRTTLPGSISGKGRALIPVRTASGFCIPESLSISEPPALSAREHHRNSTLWPDSAETTEAAILRKA